MRNTLLLLLIVPFFLKAQSIPVRSVTIFKNGKSMVERSGKVSVENRRYSTRVLPPALFGTYWASSASGDLTGIYTTRDSLETSVPKIQTLDLLEQNKNQTLRMWILPSTNQQLEVLEGKFIRRLTDKDPYNQSFLFQTTDNRFLYLYGQMINRVEFKDEPTCAEFIVKKSLHSTGYEF